jgi:hypothetical protein
VRSFTKLLAIAALAGCLPLAAAAEPDASGPEDAAASAQTGPEDAAASAQTGPEDAAASAQTGPEDAAASPRAGESAPAPLPPIDPNARVDAYPGIIQKVTADGLLVRRAGPASDPRAPAYMAFAGKFGVPVEGQGKNSWLALRRGDLVMVSYVAGPPHRITKVNVLPRASRAASAVPGATPVPPGRRQRSFVGYIKKKEGDELIVMSPPAAPPGRRPREIKAFVRTDHTKVGVLRDSWDDLRKGDRVRIGHQKGNPRPIDVVQVIRRGGEKPLPPGLATRLYDPEYDESVKDVDGIGETGPVPRPTLRGHGVPIKLGGGRR